MAEELTDKQRSFIDYYLGEAGGNATKAAKLAGYSERTAFAIGRENLHKPYIRAEIDRRLAERTMASNEVLARVDEQARNEAAQYIRVSDRTGLPFVDVKALLADGKAHLIKGIKMTREGPQVQFYDAQAALELLMRYHGMLTDRQEVKLSGGVETTVKRVATVTMDDL